MKIIKTQLEYKNALIKLEQIFDAKPNTTKGDELELLSLLTGGNYISPLHRVVYAEA